MGAKHSNRRDDDEANQPSTLSAQQASTLQRLFSRGLHPDVALLPYQMRRMKVDAPPKTKENRKTIRMKNICHLNKKTFDLKHLSDNKYAVTFEYSTTLEVYCSIYFFVAEATNKYNCTTGFDEKYRRTVSDALAIEEHDDEKKEAEVVAGDDVDDLALCNMQSNQNCIGTTYLLPKGYNLTFEQSHRDHMDLNAINYKFFQTNPAVGYYPIIVTFSLKKPRQSMLCSQDHRGGQSEHKNVRAQTYETMDEATKQDIADEVARARANGIECITRSTYYAKLVLGSDNLYKTEVISQKTQVKNRAFESQDIYGLDRTTDPYSGEDNLCVICMTMPRDTALCPCRHLCMCSGCTAQLLKRTNKCPVCRHYISETIRISRTQPDSGSNQLLDPEN